VEEPEHLGFLRNERCSSYQGFIASAALDGDDATRFIVASRTQDAAVA